ncbi:hydroxyacid dehydrogenase [Candidatus Daviesbacteria bacterium]|nr:hydroxyacid dehydrogenase [Candidatus Daviesbacteria bacterium]
MKIAFFEITRDEEINFFKEKLSQHDLFFSKEPLDANPISNAKDFDLISVFVSSKIDAAALNELPNLKAVFPRSTGFDNIDVNTAKQKNIPVSNVPAYGSHTVAEFTFSLILNLTRKTYLAINRVKTEKNFSFEGFRGMDLFGKTLGVIGTGKIGSNVMRIAKSFGMEIMAFDTFPNHDLANDLKFRYCSLDLVLQSSDIVTIHVPYNKETHHLLNSSNLQLIKQGSLLINTSRGGVVETDALFKALSGGRISGAALDVLEEEEELKEEIELLSKNAIPQEKYKNILEDHMLISLPQVIITPHMAFYTKEAEQSIRQTTVDNINSFLSGAPQNIVNG